MRKIKFRAWDKKSKKMFIYREHLERNTPTLFAVVIGEDYPTANVSFDNKYLDDRDVELL